MDSNAAFLEKRFCDLARREGKTRFLEPGEMTVLARKAALEEGVQVLFCGGYPEAERTVAVFYSFIEPDEDFISCLKLEWNVKYAIPGHRDLLGAIMGLGIEREMFGDILVGEGCAHVFVLTEIADYILSNLDSAGRTKLHVSFETEEIHLPEPEGVYLRETVNTPRLDAIIAAGYDLSREKAQKLVLQGFVKLNHVECTHTDAHLSDNDLISVRGFGRLRLIEIVGETRKGRTAIRLFRYGK
ncbi:MAG: RNA-binding protein [Clostridiales bacterium]|nr:RNA-binding protein [Clostridiales bacterium]